MPRSFYEKFSDKSELAATWAAIALGFSIPISTALDNVLLLLILVLWLASGRYAEKLALIRGNPVALAALALFGMLCAGLLYGERNPGDGLGYLLKYDDLLFIPLFISLFRDSRNRNRALFAFSLALALTLLLSFGIRLGIVAADPAINSTALDSAAFKKSLTQYILLAFGAFLFLQQARSQAAWPARGGYFLLAALTTYNVLFIGLGRTGQFILLMLFFLFFIQTFRWKGVVLAVALLAPLLGAAYLTSDSFRSRFDTAKNEALSWRADQAVDHTSSVGVRLEFYHNTLAIVRDHPLFGAGTGTFPKAYAEKIRSNAMLSSANPHNEYLLISAQIGLVGLAALLYLFYRQWRLAAWLPLSNERSLAYGLVLAIAVGCLSNSLLLDHTEGLFYAWMSGLLFAGLAPYSSKATVAS